MGEDFDIVLASASPRRRELLGQAGVAFRIHAVDADEELTPELAAEPVEAVKKLSWEDLDDLTKVFSGCNQYVFDRLNTKCKTAGAITTEQLDAIRNTVIREELL